MTVNDQPEIMIIRDFYASSTSYKSNATENIIHIIQITHTGQTISSDFDCMKQEHVQKLQATLKLDNQLSSIATQVIIVPDLTPVTLDLLGQGLLISHRVFVNHLWLMTVNHSI